MSPNPFSNFIHSRKFWAFVITSGSNLLVYFATKYLAPSSVEDVKMLLGFIDGLAVIYIGSIAWEDGKRLENPPIVQTETVKKPSMVIETTTNIPTLPLGIPNNPSTHLGG